ncbi:MAG: damage-control phosphatase ARMT1 family protein [Anaerolineales bacterium]|jgi:hypothetical protein
MNMTGHYPPPIYSTEPGSWAFSTVSKRLPEIARRIMAENQLGKSAVNRLELLIKDIQSGKIRSLEDQGAPDQQDWDAYIDPYLGKGWLEVPWFFAEHYFYRRVMEAVEYFKLGLDPFAYQKRQGLETSRQDISVLAAFLSRALVDPQQLEDSLLEGLYFSLWGNQADLSLWPADAADSPKHDSRKTLQDHLLANHIQPVLDLLLNRPDPVPQVDLMVDNAGFELVADLGLADLMLGLGLVNSLVLHVKAHPTFVSDVIQADVGETIAFLCAERDTHIKDFGKRLETYRNQGQLQTKSSFFWNSPLPMWQYPPDLGNEWRGSALLISKGDANYRRILGDRQWDFTVPFAEAVDYLPLPLAALRTVKAELAVGLELEQIQDVFNQDPNWLTDGKWGVIHYAPGSG